MARSGPNGMTVVFCKKHWGTVGAAMGEEVQKFFSTGVLNKAHNHTFIALIPKCPSDAKVEQFRPIALCNVFFKIITKIIAGRLRQVLADIIHPNQAAFIPHCSNGDNIVINHHEDASYEHEERKAWSDDNQNRPCKSL